MSGLGAVDGVDGEVGGVDAGAEGEWDWDGGGSGEAYETWAWA